MERREPRIEPDAPGAVRQDWGNLRFRPRRAEIGDGAPDDNADARFWIGIVVFLVVAAAYPWYSYWVNSRLVARDMQAVVEGLGRKSEAADAELRQQMADRSRRSAEAARRMRLAGVRVIGAFPRASGTVAIVDLGQAQLPEATSVICRQAGAMLGRSLSGEALRVQRGRGGQPAVDIGNIRC